MEERVVVTGLGAVTPLAVGIGKTWDKILLGESGIRTIQSFDPLAFGLDVTIAGEIPDFNPTSYIEKKQVRRLDRTSQLGIVAVQEALAQSGLHIGQENDTKIGVIFGTGIGGFITTLDQYDIFKEKGVRRVSPFTIPMLMPNATAANIAATFSCLGPCLAPTSACASGSDAVGIGFDLIRSRRVHACIVGGADAVVIPFAIAGFGNMGALTTLWNSDPVHASRPFDRNRSGFVISEGSAALVLENETFARARRANILAEVAGYGSSSDGYHITAPHPQGDGAIRASRAALSDAGLGPSAITYINAHGTSTPLNDRIETSVIREVYGSHAKTIPVSSTKSMTGHLLGAAGALEAAFCVLALQTGFLPRTMNLDEVETDCDLRHIRETEKAKQPYAAVSNAFGFGGHNSVLVFKTYSNVR